MTISDGADEAAWIRSITVPQKLDVPIAESMLKDAKQILDQLGVTFFLGSGTCLGAVRDNRITPWDDDVDLASVIGLHGLTEETVERVIDAFKDQGYFTRVGHQELHIGTSMMKSSTRTDWTCFRIIDDSIFQYPGVRTPIRLFTQLKEIDFLGDKFRVPNPPEEYLRMKYGPNWMTPKAAGFQKDVVEKIPDDALVFGRSTLHWSPGSIRVLDYEGNPVSGAEVVVVGLGRSRTNKQGYIKFYVPRESFYAVIIRYDSHEEVLYEEILTPGGAYLYRPDPSSNAGRLAGLSQE